MRLPKAIMQITKVAAAASLCFATSAAIASTAVRPSVKAVAAPALNADLPALPVRAGAPTDESENNIMGLALLPLLGLLDPTRDGF